MLLIKSSGQDLEKLDGDPVRIKGMASLMVSTKVAYCDLSRVSNSLSKPSWAECESGLQKLATIPKSRKVDRVTADK